MKNQIVLFLLFTNLVFSQNTCTKKYSGYVIFENGVLSEEYPTSTLITFNYKKEGDIKTVSDGIEEEYDLYSKFGEDKIEFANDGHEFRRCNYFSDLAKKNVIIQIYKGEKNLRIIAGNDYLEYVAVEEANILKDISEESCNLPTKINMDETYACIIEESEVVNGKYEIKGNSKGYIKIKEKKIYYQNGNNNWKEREFLSQNKDIESGNYLYSSEYGDIEIDYKNNVIRFYEETYKKCYTYNLLEIEK